MTEQNKPLTIEPQHVRKVLMLFALAGALSLIACSKDKGGSARRITPNQGAANQAPAASPSPTPAPNARASGDSRTNGDVGRLNDRVAELQRQIEALESRPATASAPAELGPLRAELQALRGELDAEEAARTAAIVDLRGQIEALRTRPTVDQAAVDALTLRLRTLEERPQVSLSTVEGRLGVLEGQLRDRVGVTAVEYDIEDVVLNAEHKIAFNIAISGRDKVPAIFSFTLPGQCNQLFADDRTLTAGGCRPDTAGGEPVNLTEADNIEEGACNVEGKLWVRVPAHEGAPDVEFCVELAQDGAEADAGESIWTADLEADGRVTLGVGIALAEAEDAIYTMPVGSCERLLGQGFRTGIAADIGKCVGPLDTRSLEIVTLPAPSRETCETDADVARLYHLWIEIAEDEVKGCIKSVEANRITAAANERLLQSDEVNVDIDPVDHKYINQTGQAARCTKLFGAAHGTYSARGCVGSEPAGYTGLSLNAAVMGSAQCESGSSRQIWVSYQDDATTLKGCIRPVAKLGSLVAPFAPIALTSNTPIAQSATIGLDAPHCQQLFGAGNHRFSGGQCIPTVEGTLPPITVLPNEPESSCDSDNKTWLNYIQADGVEVDGCVTSVLQAS